MTKTLIYSCVFFNENYKDLINLLLKSYKLFGNASDDVDYLIICNPDFQKNIQLIFDNLEIAGKIWCLNLNTKFEAGYSRLKIFDYPDLHLYNKILYLDCDILVTNSINKMLDFQLEDKLYCIKEGNTSHVFWGSQFFDENPNCPAFTSAVLLFNNNIIIKDLFQKILSHIQNHIQKNLSIPLCLDQPFIIYHAIKNNLYDNQKLMNIVYNNPAMFFNDQIINHFPGGPGNYGNKIVKMSNFMKNVMFNIKFPINKKSKLKISFVTISNVKDSLKMKYILESSLLQDIYLNTIGLGKRWSFIQKIYWMYDYLKVCDKEIVIFTDAYDVFYLHNTDLIYEKFISLNTHILWSSEKWYTHQLDKDKKFYDNISKGEYKYLNTGTVIGYKSKLLEFYGDMINTMETDEFWVDLNKNNWYKETGYVDQTIISTYIANNYNKYNLRLDYDLNIFYVPVKDWDDINLCKQNIRKYNPSIVHVPWKGKYEYVLKELFYHVYPILNKTYIWGNSNIEFLENGEMIAFGTGKYSFIKKYLAKCDFGGREHLLKFNDDYSRFISVRKDDFEVIFGDIIKQSLNPTIVMQTDKNKPQMIDYDFIEIGTSDYDTLIQTCSKEQYGISVEPIKYYLDKLPNKPNVIKVNKAVSDVAGSGFMTYIPKSDLPKDKYWLKGCNMLNSEHPCQTGYEKIKINVDIITFADLCIQNNVRKIKYLKVDTEGFDLPIIKSMIEYCDENPISFPDKIMFESITWIQEMGDRKNSDLDNMICELEKRNYKLIKKEWDTVLEKIILK